MSGTGIVGARATPEERAAIDAVLGRPQGDGHDWEQRVAERRPPARDRLLPALIATTRAAGYVSPGAVAYLSERLDLKPAEIYGVASFYALLPVAPRPRLTLHVCDDVVCRGLGAEELMADLEAAWGAEGEPVEPGAPTWHRSPCLGRCAEAPAAFVQKAGTGATWTAWAPAQADRRALDALAAGLSLPPPDATAVVPWSDESLLARAAGAEDVTRLDAYRARGGYEALREALRLGPEGVLRAVRASGLTGRGGAAFPTGVKWEAVARHPSRPHWVVCNADESEPGTFKDRILLERDPFAVLEGLTVAAYVVGARRGFVFVRAEYDTARRILEAAAEQARSRGLLGEGILGRDFAFDIEIRSGAGAYICGDETALFRSLEGERPEPRNKPPFPTEHGLFGQPTVINNVETLAHVPWILRHGPGAFAAVGVAGAPGTRLWSLSGAVVRPGVYETPTGIRLGELLARAGGVRDGRALRAVLLGGASGAFVGPDALDMELSPEGVRPFGATLGSGAVMVFDDTVDLADRVYRIARFFREESCGQCAPCRLGTTRQEELVARLVNGRPLGSVAQEQALFADLSQVMRDASICGLGQTAANAVASAFRLGILGGNREVGQG